MSALSTDSDITWKLRSSGRSFSTSRIHRDVSHAQGQIGSNQKSTLVRSLIQVLLRKRVLRCRQHRYARSHSRRLGRTDMTDCGDGCPQPDQGRCARPRRVAVRLRVRGGARPDRRRRQARRADVPVQDHDPVHRVPARRGHVRRRDRGRVPRGHPQRAGAGHVGLPAGGRDGAARPGRRQRARRRRRPALHEHRRGAAPVRRPGRRRGLPLLAVRDRGRQADVRVLRPARPQGHVRAHGDRAAALGGRLQRAGGRGHRGRRRRAGGRGSAPRRRSRRTSPRWSPGRTTR